MDSIHLFKTGFYFLFVSLNQYLWAIKTCSFDTNYSYKKNDTNEYNIIYNCIWNSLSIIQFENYVFLV